MFLPRLLRSSRLVYGWSGTGPWLPFSFGPPATRVRRVVAEMGAVFVGGEKLGA